MLISNPGRFLFNRHLPSGFLLTLGNPKVIGFYLLLLPGFYRSSPDDGKCYWRRQYYGILYYCRNSNGLCLDNGSIQSACPRTCHTYQSNLQWRTCCNRRLCSRRSLAIPLFFCVARHLLQEFRISCHSAALSVYDGKPPVPPCINRVNQAQFRYVSYDTK